MADLDIWICYGPEVADETFVPWTKEAINNLSTQLEHDIQPYVLGQVPREKIDCSDRSSTFYNVEEWLEKNYVIRDYEHYILIVKCDVSLAIGAGYSKYNVSQPGRRDWFSGYAAISIVNQGINGFLNNPFIQYDGKRGYKATVIHEICHTLMTNRDDGNGHLYCPEPTQYECREHVCGTAYSDGNISPMLFWYSNNSSYGFGETNCQKTENICFNSGEDNSVTLLTSACTQTAANAHITQHIHWYETDDTYLDERWANKTIYTDFDEPVVIAKPPTNNDPDPCHTRIKNVSSNSFDARIEEWDYLDGSHAFEEVGYLITNVGTQEQSDGTKAESGVVYTDDTWATVNFDVNFNKFPILLTQSQTQNNSDPIVTRNKNVDFNSFEVRVQEEEDKAGYYLQEAIGYFAIEAGTGYLEGVPYEADVIIYEVDENWYKIYFDSVYSDPVFLADIRSFNGSETCELRTRNLDSNSVEVRIEEEKAADNETNHKQEDIGYLVFNDTV